MEQNKQIRQLIGKYFDGQTSRREEETLRRYFLRKNIPAGWEIYRPIFQYFSEERKAKKLRPSMLHLRRWIPAAVAACFLLAVGVRLFSPPPALLLSESTIYIDGKPHRDVRLMQSEALKALENLADGEEDAYSSQIEALDLFFNTKKIIE
jgi:hypothetical protein